MSDLKPYADLKVKTRTYIDKDGKEKGSYVKVGTLFASPHMNHMFIKLEAIPIASEWDGAVSVFKRETDAPANDGNDNDVEL